MASAIASIYTYPWDVHDEGVDLALGRIAETAGQNEVSLACTYHVATYFLPHNPKRRLYYGEDGMVLFRPAAMPYPGTRLEPRVSHLVDSDAYLASLAEACRQRGLEFTAWVVYCYNHHLARTFPECAKQDALGNRYLAQLCPAHPEVRAYFRELTRDLCRRCRPGGIHIESLHYLRYDYGFLNPKTPAPIATFDQFLLSLCFCEHCAAAADAAGMDGRGFRGRVAAYLEQSLPGDPGPEALRPAPPEMIAEAFDGALMAYLEARSETATSLYEQVAADARAEGVRHVRAALPSASGMPLTGLDPDRVLAATDRLCTGLPELGSMERLARQKEGLPAGKQVICGAPAPQAASGAALRERLLAAREAGAAGFTFYNYGLLREHQLQAIGEARDAWQ